MAERQIMVVLGADVSSLSTAMARAQANVKKTAQTIENELSKADKASSGALKNIGSNFTSMVNNLGKSALGISGKIGGIGAAASSIVPAIAGAGAGVGAFASALASAGVGVAGFGAVAVANLNDVFNATDETFSQLSAAQQKAYKDLKGFKSFWGDFAKEFEQPTMDIFSKGLGAAKEVLTAIKPAIESTANAVNGLMDSLSKSLKSDDMMVFFDFINETAGGMVERLGKVFGNTFMGIGNLLVGFAPLANEMMDSLVAMTDKFRQWSSAFRDSNGLQVFMDYVRTNAPVIMGLIGDIASTVMNLIIVLAPLGQTVLGILGQIGSALSTFTQSFKNAFSMGNFEGAGVAISTLVQSILSTLIASLPQLIAAGMQIVSSLIQGVSQNIPTIVATVITLIQAMLNSILTNYPLIISAGVQLLQGLVFGIVQALPQLLEMITQIVQMFGTLVVTYLPTIIQSGITLLMGLVQGLITALPQFIAMVQSLIPQFVAMIQEMLPQIIQSGIDILLALIDGIVNILPQLVTTVIELVMQIADTVLQNLPMIIQAGIKVLNALIEGILSILPQLIVTAVQLVSDVMDTIIDNLPMIISAGMDLLVALIEGITDMLPQLIKMAMKLIIEIVGELISNLPKIIAAGIEIIFALIEGLLDAIPDIVGAIPEIVSAIFDAFGEVDWGEIGKEIINGIAAGIGDFAGTLIKKGKDVAERALGGIKSFLGIHSPSRVFRDEVGKWIPEGIAVGIESNAESTTKAVTDLGNDMVMRSPFETLTKSLNPMKDFKGVGKDKGNTEVSYQITINATVREEADIEKIVKEIKRNQNNLNRAGGIVDEFAV